MKKDIVLNSRIAKLIIIELRNEKTTSDDTYHDATNTTQIFFKEEKLEGLLLIMSRDFCHY